VSTARPTVLLAVAMSALTVVAGCATEPVRMDPVVVMSPVQLAGAMVRGAGRDWHVTRRAPPRYGDPVPVQVTAYCLQGRTRRGRYVRPGIAAADPRFFPLSRYVEVYVGSEYLGRFLVDDTGGRVRGPMLDIWMEDCAEARRFGRQNGTAVLVPRSTRPVRPVSP
jgi:3D (Asp-Asp-Asp) domain-containing protein